MAKQLYENLKSFNRTYLTPPWVSRVVEHEGFLKLKQREKMLWQSSSERGVWGCHPPPNVWSPSANFGLSAKRGEGKKKKRKRGEDGE